MTDAGLKISIIYTSVPDFFLCISYHAWVYDQQSSFISVKAVLLRPGSMGRLERAQASGSTEPRWREKKSCEGKTNTDVVVI